MTRYDKIVTGLLVWTVLQDFVLSILLNVTGATTIIKIIFYSKDVLFIALFIFSLFKVKKLPIGIWLALGIYIFLIMIQTGIGYSKGIEVFSLFSSIRGWLLLPGFLLIGYNLSSSPKKVYSFFFNFLLIIAVIGIVEFVVDSYITSTIPLWKRFIGIGNFMADIKGQENRLVQGLPGNFYGQYGGEFFSQKRLVSLWGGPLTAGYVLVIPCIFYLAHSYQNGKMNQKYLVKGLIFCLAILLTFTRGIILPLVLVIFFLIARTRKGRILIFFSGFLVLFIALFYREKIMSYVFDGSTTGHLNSVFDSLKEVSILGKGIATFGVDSSIGTENTYISCIGQLGLLGLILYFGCLCYPIYKIFKAYKKTHKVVFLSIVLIGVLLIFTGFISEQLLAYTSIAPFFILLGHYLKKSKEVKVYE